jgi:hypothetical protein
MNMVNLGPLSCGAWLEVSTAEGRRRICVLAAGHYRERGTGDSWHTDCPDAVGRDRPVMDHESHDSRTHPDRGPGWSCGAWADYAAGAHPSDATLSEPIEAEKEEQAMEPVELPSYTAEIMFRTGDGERVVSATLYGPAEFLATAVGSITEAFRDEVEK